MGAAELLGHLRHLRHNRAALLALLTPTAALKNPLDRPALFLPVDAPDFHLPLGARARAANIPTLAVVAPQVWAWRPSRARTVGRSVDRLLCLFSFEPDLFTPHGLDARFVGHPAPDRLPPRDPIPGSLALLPGSRPDELRRLWPDFRATGLLHQQAGGSVLVGLAPGVSPAALPDLPPGWSLVDSTAVLARAERALTKSGTVTLELALAGIPAVVAHRVSPLTYWLGRLLIHGVSHLALPNILLSRLTSDRVESLLDGGQGRTPPPPHRSLDSTRSELPALSDTRTHFRRADISSPAPYQEFIQHFTPRDLLAALAAARPPPTQALARLVGPPGMAARCAQEIADMLPRPDIR